MIKRTFTLAAVAAALLAACVPAPNNPATGDGQTPMPGATPTAAPTSAPAASYMQMERLARPAINEGLLITNELLNTWNMVPPSADLTPAAQPIAAEATTVLKALGNTDAQVAALFKALLPDVMRIDTTRTSGYVGTPDNPLGNVTADLRPIGGRLPGEDVIDVTLQLIVPGGAPGAAPIAGLESDNVSYAGPNAGGTGHKPLPKAFPYLAEPN